MCHQAPALSVDEGCETYEVVSIEAKFCLATNVYITSLDGRKEACEMSRRWELRVTHTYGEGMCSNNLLINGRMSIVGSYHIWRRGSSAFEKVYATGAYLALRLCDLEGYR